MVSLAVVQLSNTTPILGIFVKSATPGIHGMAGSTGACDSGKTRPGGGALQPGRRPYISGSGSAALDVGRRGLLQDPGLQARIRERPVPARTQRGPSVGTATGPCPRYGGNTASILAKCRRCLWRYRRSRGDRANSGCLLVRNATGIGQICRPMSNKKWCACWRSS
jgi:hypothetical protein